MKDKFAEQDKAYQQKLRDLEHCLIGDLNIRKKFHLNSDSLAEDAVKESAKKSTRRSSETGGTDSVPTTPIRISGKIKPLVGLGPLGEIDGPKLGTDISTVAGMSLLGEAKLTEADSKAKSETSSRVQLVYDADCAFFSLSLPPPPISM